MGLFHFARRKRVPMSGAATQAEIAPVDLQAFILEPILTPSGLVDAPDHTPNVMDWVDHPGTDWHSSDPAALPDSSHVAMTPVHATTDASAAHAATPSDHDVVLSGSGYGSTQAATDHPVTGSGYGDAGTQAPTPQSGDEHANTPVSTTPTTPTATTTTVLPAVDQTIASPAGVSVVGSEVAPPLVTLAASQPLVGMIDTGFAAQNPHLDYSHITLGHDYVDGDNNPLLQPGRGNDHGTGMLGIVAATQNQGVEGRHEATPLWLSRATGSGHWADALVAFVAHAKATDAPHAVVNLSFDLTQMDADGSVSTRFAFTPQELAALHYAHANHILIVTAAGNQAGSMSALGQASQQFDNIITVGAADGMGRAAYASYGDGLDLLANGGTPEQPILTTMGAGMGVVAGSSAAAAQVTGAVSLVWQANPALSYRQVIDLLEHAATDVGATGWDAATGFGVLNLAATIDLAKQIKPDTATAIAGTAGARNNFMPIPWATTAEMTAGERPTDDWSEPLPDPTSDDGAGTETDGQARPPEGSETASGDSAPTNATPPDGAAAEPDPTDQSTDDPTTTDAAGGDTGAVGEPTDNGTDGDSTENEGAPTDSDAAGNVPTDEPEADSPESGSELTGDGTDSSAATVAAPHDLSLFRFSGGHLSEDGEYIPPDPSDPTNFNTPFIQGKASPGVTVQLWEAGQGIGQTTADDEGNWFTNTTVLADGVHTLTAIAIDLNGTVSPPSDPLVITIDTQLPATPTIQLAPVSDSGSSDSDLRTNATTFRLSGTADPGLVVQILHEGFLLGTATAAADGTWQAAVTQEDGVLYQSLTEYAYTLTAATTDAAGNTSSSDPLPLIIDTQAETPEITGLTTESDTGSSQTDGITRISNPVVTGRSETGATVQLFSDDAQLVGQTTADANGVWQISPSDFEPGTHYLRAVATDVAGNVSGASYPFALTITLQDNVSGGGYGGEAGGGYGSDPTGGGYGSGAGYGGDPTGNPTQVPLAPTALQLVAASEAGSSDSDQITGNNTPTIRGLGTAGTIVRLFNNGFSIGQTRVNDDGTWQLNPYYPFSDGVQVLTAITIDNRGYCSPESAPLQFAVDTQAPLAPSALQLSPTTDTGTLGDQRTANPTPLITGAAAPKAQVQIFWADQLVGQATADADGFWQAVTLPLADGEQTLMVSAINRFGYRSPASALILTIQTQPPTPPSQLALLTAADTGRSQSDNLTQNDRPTVVGQAVANGIVTLFSGDDWLGETTADARGNWQIELTDTLPEGVAQLYAVTTDEAGLVSSSSAPLTLTIDQTPPNAPTGLRLVGTSDHGVSTTAYLTNNITPTIAGNGDPGTLVQLYSETKLLGTTVVDADGQWQVTTPFLPDGTHTLVAVGYDAAENRSLNSTPLLVTIDATPPDLSLVSLFNNTGWAVGDRLSGWAKNAGDPVTAVTYQIYAADNTTTPLVSAVVPVAADGAFNAPLALDGLTVGQPYVFRATATDAAGNVATRTLPFQMAAPALPRTDPNGASGNQPVGSYAQRLYLILTAAIQALSGNAQAALSQNLNVLLGLGNQIEAGTLPPTLAGTMQNLFALANQPLTQAQAEAAGQAYAETLAQTETAILPQVMEAKLLATAYQVPALVTQLPTDTTETNLSSALKHLGQTYLATLAEPTQAVTSVSTAPHLLDLIWHASEPSALSLAATRLGTALGDTTAPAQAVQMVDRLLQVTQQLPTVQAQLHDATIVSGLVDMGFAYARLHPTNVDDPALLAQLPLQQLWQGTGAASVAAAQPGMQAFFGGFPSTNAQRTLLDYQADLLDRLQKSGSLDAPTVPNPVAIQNAMAAGTWLLAPQTPAAASSPATGSGSAAVTPFGAASPAISSGGSDLSTPLSWYAPPQTLSPSPMDTYFDPDGKPKFVGQPLHWKITIPVYSPFGVGKPPNYTFSFYPWSYGGVRIRKIEGWPQDIFLDVVDEHGAVVPVDRYFSVPNSASLSWEPAYGYGYIQLLPPDDPEAPALPPASAWAGFDPDHPPGTGDITLMPPEFLPPGSNVGQLPSGGQFVEPPPGTIEPYPAGVPDFPPECGLHPLPKPITEMDYLEVCMAVFSRVPCKAGNDLKTMVEKVLNDPVVQGALVFLLALLILAPGATLNVLLALGRASVLIGIGDFAEGVVNTFKAKFENDEALVDKAAGNFAQAFIALAPELVAQGTLPLLAKLERFKGLIEGVPIIGNFAKLLNLLGMKAFLRVFANGKALAFGKLADKFAALDATVAEAFGIAIQKYPQALDEILEFGPQAIDELTAIMSRFNTTPDVLLNLLSKEGMSVEELKNLLKLEGADPELLLKYFNEGKAIEEIRALLGNCFVAGTKVLTTAGEKNIEDIQIGDWVIADDPTTPGGIEPRQVLDTYVRHTNELFDLSIDGEVISTTGEHPFWVPDQGWVKAKDLQVGTTLQTEDGRIIDVDGVARREGDFTVYNLKVDDFHTYYVSDLEILVHNANYDIPDKPVGSLKLVTDKWLKSQNVDPHTVKDGVPGKGREFDVYKDKNNNLWAVRKQTQNPNAEPYYIGKLDSFKE